MPLSEKPILGQYLEKYLQKHKMLQKDFAALIGVQANTLSQWATGKRQPDNATLVLLAKTFGISVDELLGVDTQTHLRQPVAQDDIVIVCRNGKQEIHKLTPEQLESIDILLDGYQEKNTKDK